MRVRLFLLLILVLLPMISLLRAEKGFVYTVEVKGEINTSTEGTIAEAVDRANKDGAAALIILLDTPGGAGDAMMRIIQKINTSFIPVIIYVYPKGAISASAGTFIALGAHLIAMSPSTSIGAAQPVLGYNPATGQIVEAPEKYKKYYAAVMRSLAEERGRNPEIAEQFVTENLSLTPQEALEKGMTDVIAENVPDLLIKTEGMKTKSRVGGEILELHLKNLEIRTIDISLIDEFISTINNPQIAYILMIIGIYGLIFGFMTPGFYFPEILGAICLILAFVAFNYIGVQWGGLVLIVLGIAFFILEVKAHSFGAFTVAGIISFIIGAIFLFRVTTTDEGQLSRLVSEDWWKGFTWTMIIVTVFTALLFAAVVYAVYKVLKTRPKTGWEEMIGAEGVAAEDFEEEGQIKVHGERWKARTKEKLLKGDKARVVGKQGLVLIVERIKEE